MVYGLQIENKQFTASNFYVARYLGLLDKVPENTLTKFYEAIPQNANPKFSGKYRVFELDYQPQKQDNYSLQIENEYFSGDTLEIISRTSYTHQQTITIDLTNQIMLFRGLFDPKFFIPSPDANIPYFSISKIENFKITLTVKNTEIILLGLTSNKRYGLMNGRNKAITENTIEVMKGNEDIFIRTIAKPGNMVNDLYINQTYSNFPENSEVWFNFQSILSLYSTYLQFEPKQINLSPLGVYKTSMYVSMLGHLTYPVVLFKDKFIYWKVI